MRRRATIRRAARRNPRPAGSRCTRWAASPLRWARLGDRPRPQQPGLRRPPRWRRPAGPIARPGCEGSRSRSSTTAARGFPAWPCPARDKALVSRPTRRMRASSAIVPGPSCGGVIYSTSGSRPNRMPHDGPPSSMSPRISTMSAPVAMLSRAVWRGRGQVQFPGMAGEGAAQKLGLPLFPR